MAIHIRKDEEGTWRDIEGNEQDSYKPGVVLHYGKCLPEYSRRTTSTVSSSRPNISKNAGIHVDQVKSFNKQCATGVTYDNNGNLQSTSYAAREREARRRGLSFG